MACSKERIINTKRVKFIDVHDQYSYNEDVICKVKFDSYLPKKKDRIGIFKIGWYSIKDCIVHKWVPADDFSKEASVVFESRILPKKQDELYQFCYLSGDNELYDASLPFTLTPEQPDRIMAEFRIFSEDPTKHLSLCSATSGCCESEENKKLREENELLKACLKALVVDKAGSPKSTNYEAQLVEIKEIVYNLKGTVVQQHQELAALKTRFADMQKENYVLHREKSKLEKQLEGTEELTVKMHQTNIAQDDKADSSKFQPNGSNVEFSIDNLRSMPPFPL